MQEKNAKAVVSLTECDHSPIWCNTLPPDGRMDDFVRTEYKNLPRQELPTYYRYMEESEEKGLQRGIQQGQIASLRTVLLLKGDIPEKLDRKLARQTKSDVIEQWLKIAVESPDIQTFEMRIEE